MNWVTVLGLIAGFCTSVALLPQAIKSWKTQKTKDVSLSMCVVLVIGVLLWLNYGLLIKDLPVILANSITFILALSVLFFKIRHG